MGSVSDFPELGLEDALLLQPEPEPSPESASRFFGAEISAKFGRVDPKNRVDDVRLARPIHNSELDALDQIVFNAGSNFSVDIVGDIIIDVVIVRRFDGVKAVFLQLEIKNKFTPSASFNSLV